MEDLERRENNRVEPKDIAFVALRPEFEKLGRVLDISLEGLCFRYISQGSSVDKDIKVEIDLFVNDNPSYLQNIPCETVYDTTIGSGSTLTDGMGVRRCGLKFKDLSKNHMNSLEQFIENIY